MAKICRNKQKHRYLENRTIPCLHGGELEITLTVPKSVKTTDCFAGTFGKVLIKNQKKIYFQGRMRYLLFFQLKIDYLR